MLTINLKTDVTTEESIKRSFAMVKSEFGRIDNWLVQAASNNQWKHYSSRDIS